jgi:hypothetical protein
MEFNRNLFSERLKSFYTLTRGFVNDEKDEKTRIFLRKIIITGHNLVTGKIKDEDIDFDIYEIVVLMTSADRPYMRDYLTGIDPNNITDADYKSFNDVLSSMIADNSFGL